MLKTMLIMLVAVVAITAGDLLMSQAMRSLGEFRDEGLPAVLHWLGQVFTTPKVWAAIGCMAVSFFMWLWVLSRSDLSFVLPLTALTYVLNAFLAGPVLAEEVGPLRWVGTLLIVVGAALVGASHPEER